MLNTKKGWMVISWSTAANLLKDQYNKAKRRAFLVSPHNTNEELLLMRDIAQKSGSDIFSGAYRKIFTDQIFEERTNNLCYKDLETTEHIVILGEISHTLRTLCRYQQRKGKGLTLINNLDSRFNKFADKLYQDSNLEEALDKFLGDNEKLPERTIFVYNRNRLSEKLIKKIWDFAVNTSNFGEGSGILETSDWNNLQGFRDLRIEEYATSLGTGFILSYGEMLPNRLKFDTNCFAVAVDTHIDKDNPADLLLPKPVYLEIEGSVLSDDGHLRQFKNPMQSMLFPATLQIFYEAGLITLEKVEPSVWNNRVEKSLAAIPERKTISRDYLRTRLAEAEIKGVAPAVPGVTQWKFLKDLHKTCSQDHTEEDIDPEKSEIVS